MIGKQIFALQNARRRRRVFFIKPYAQLPPNINFGLAKIDGGVYLTNCFSIAFAIASACVCTCNSS